MCSRLMGTDHPSPQTFALLLGDRVYHRQFLGTAGATGVSPDPHYRGKRSPHHPRLDRGSGAKGTYVSIAKTRIHHTAVVTTRANDVF